jgi:hypothetical protein
VVEGVTATLTHECPDCRAVIGDEHDDGCDVARCMAYGTQRVQCSPGARMVVRGILPNGGVDVDWETDGHDCGRDVWSGRWPGLAECEEFDWWAVFVPYGNPSWRPVAAGTPGAVHDLNRLVVEAKWSPELRRWVR